MAYEIKSKPYWGLNVLIVILIGVLIAAILIPRQIWNEEQEYREISRDRMEKLWRVETAFRSLNGDYTEFGEHVVRVVNQVYDSLSNNAEYVGTHQLSFPPKIVNLQVDSATIRIITTLLDSTIGDTAWTAYRQEVIDTYNSITGDSTYIGQLAYRTLTAAYDSIQNQDEWLGARSVELPFQYQVDVYETYATYYDTSFVTTERMRTTVADTSYWSEMTTDNETGEMDTTWVPKRDLEDMRFRYNNLRILDTSVIQQDRWVADTMAAPPTLDWLSDPLTGKPYIFKRSADGLHLRIESPIEGEYTEKRYYVFTLSDTSHGYVEDGEISWEDEL